MAYHFDILDDALVIDGWENGIAQDPYDGTANLQNVNVTTVPGEASVAPATAVNYSAPVYGAVTVNADTTMTLSTADSNVPKLENNQAVYFTNSSISNLNNLPSVYWVQGVTHNVGGNCLFGLSSSYNSSSVVNNLGTSGTAVLGTVNPDFESGQNGASRGNLLTKHYMASSRVNSYSWALDTLGQLWSNMNTTGTTSSWTFAGNKTSGATSGNGNGLVYWQTFNASTGLQDGWIMVFRNQGVDLVKIEASGALVSGLSWVLEWDIKTASSGTDILFTPTSLAAPHEAIVTPDNEVVFTDSQYVWGILQAEDSTSNLPITFSPTDSTSYNFLYQAIPTSNDISTSMTYMGSYIYIGGLQNKIYTWDGSGSGVSSQPAVLLPENFTSSLVTVNMNIYVFSGNRGIIYLTNGSQVSVYTKVPDHISGSVQPVYVWGGTTYIQNKLYFGVSVFSPDFSTIYTAYSGIWAVDLLNTTLYNANTLSTSTAIPTGLLPQSVLPISKGTSAPSGFRGYGLYAVWYDASTENGSTGIDASVSTAFSGGGTIETEMIPIGTFNKPRQFTYVEYKLATKMVNGESIKIYYRTNFTDSYTLMFTDTATSAYTPFSNSLPTSTLPAQWIQLKIVLTVPNTVTSPSYVRLKEIRLAGIVGPTLAQAMEMSI